MHKSKSKNISSDKWLHDHFEELIAKYAGGYVVVAGKNGVVSTNHDGTPRQIIELAMAKYPGIKPLFFRVPASQEFICALAIL